jgi:hypothetical protein
MAKRARTWWIVGRACKRGRKWYPIESSKGLPYHELRTIARHMSHNGEGMIYIVQEAPLWPSVSKSYLFRLSSRE